MSRKRGAAYGNHPLVQYVRSLPEEYYLAREVAEQLGCSVWMLIYLRKRSVEPMGPSHQAQYGGIVLYLYTPERIAEIGKYLKEVSKLDQGHHRRGPVKLWTRTEGTHRRREQNRAANYRVRGVGYREKGLVVKAARMEKLSVAILDKLEKARLQRWEKVHGVPWTPK